MRWLAVLAVLVPSVAFGAPGEKQVLEVVTLQPKEKKEVTIDATEKQKLGWSHTDAGGNSASKCQHMCVMMTKQGAASGVASMHGMTMGIVPMNGKISATFENLEDFPIEIEVFQKAP